MSPPQAYSKRPSRLNVLVTEQIFTLNQCVDLSPISADPPMTERRLTMSYSEKYSGKRKEMDLATVSGPLDLHT